MSVVWADASSFSDDEARELAEQGLCILARLIVRAHLRWEVSLAATDPGERSLDNSNADTSPLHRMLPNPGPHGQGLASSVPEVATAGVQVPPYHAEEP